MQDRKFGVDFTALMLGLGHDVTVLQVLTRKHRHGPGKRTADTLHKAIGRSKYMPHQGKRECARRRRQIGLAS